MDITRVLTILIAGLMECSDMQSVRDNILSNKDLSSTVKEEIIEVIHKSNPECELNERSTDT